MNKVIIFLTTLLIALSSCDDYMSINSTLKKIINMGEKKYGLIYLGGGVAAPTKIQYFIASFKKQSNCDPNIERKLLVDFTEDYIQLIKNDEKLIANFESLPINEKHVFLQIIFKDKNNLYCNELAGIELVFGNVIFLKLNARGALEEYCSESYSEAYFKVYGTEPPERK
ncbi:MAG: hypothetical protein ACK4HV_04190 [Parachlamydiaceae bacterium]